jgi:hypothetical protein
MIWNVIDRRRRRYRWAKVHAIVEPTWHDNSVSGADQAPETTAETDVVFDERKEISVNDAITWATSQSCPATLYIRDGETLDQSSSEEVDAAARILDGFGRNNGWPRSGSSVIAKAVQMGRFGCHEDRTAGADRSPGG